MESRIKTELEEELQRLGINKNDSEKLIDEIMSSTIEITLPSKEEKPSPIGMIIMGQHGPVGPKPAVSYKPGNIKFNLDNLINPVSDGGLAIASALTVEPWIIACTVAKILHNLSNSIKIELTQLESFILETIRRYLTQGKNGVGTNTLFIQVNEFLTSTGRNNVSYDEYERAIDNLERIKVISKTNRGYKIIEKSQFGLR